MKNTNQNLDDYLATIKNPYGKTRPSLAKLADQYEPGLISIIIPSYNRGDLISETLDSILSQTYTNWECIVIDDGSTDNGIDIVNSYCAKDKRMTLVKRPDDSPKGAQTCRNIGLFLARGEFIQFFDSDDIMLPTKLNKQVKVIEKHDADFAVCDCILFKDKRDNVLSRYLFSEKGHDIVEHLVRIVINPQSALIRRKVVCDVGSWDIELERWQDWEYFTRVLAGSFAGVWHSDELVAIRMHNASISHKSSKDIHASLALACDKVQSTLKKSGPLNHNVLNALGLKYLTIAQLLYADAQYDISARYRKRAFLIMNKRTKLLCHALWIMRRIGAGRPADYCNVLFRKMGLLP